MHTLRYLGPGTPDSYSPSELIDGSLRGLNLRGLEAGVIDRFAEKVRLLTVACINQNQVNDSEIELHGVEKAGCSFEDDYAQILQNTSILEFVSKPLCNGVRTMAKDLDGLEFRVYEDIPILLEWVKSVEGTGDKDRAIDSCREAISKGIPKSFMPSIEIVSRSQLESYNSDGKLIFCSEELPPGERPSVIEQNTDGYMTVVVPAQSNQSLYNLIIGEYITREINVYALSDYLSEEVPGLSAGALQDIIHLISKIYPTKAYRNEVWNGLIERCGHEVLSSLVDALRVTQKSISNLINHEMVQIASNRYLSENPNASHSDLVQNIERLWERDLTKNIIGSGWGNKGVQLQLYMQLHL